MIVVDASVALWALVGEPARSGPAREALAVDPEWHAPGIFQFEVLARLRAITLGADELRRRHADAAVRNFVTWVIGSVDSAPLTARAWELRHNVDASDALYIAAAERLGCPLLTVDGPLIRAAGPRCAFQTVTTG